MLYAIVAVIALILDQAVKFWTTSNIVLNTGEKALIPGFIHITNVHNTGAAFSFLEGARWFFVVLCIVFVAVVIYVLVKNIISTPVARWMAVIVMAGAVGNCIDRVISGFVVDMFEFEFMTFPVFNIADLFITIGGIIFCLCILFEKGPNAAKKAAVTGGNTDNSVKPATDEERQPVVRVISSDEQPTAPAAQKPRRKHQKVEIPDFPQHPHIDAPAINPNDPFAEWERRMNEAAAPAAEKPAAPAPVNARHEGASPAAAPSKTPAVKPAATPATKPVATPATKPVATPAAKSVAAQPAAPQKTVADLDLEAEFDLDSILAEFKDD